MTMTDDKRAGDTAPDALVADAAWDEAKHPRGKGGKFRKLSAIMGDLTKEVEGATHGSNWSNPTRRALGNADAAIQSGDRSKARTALDDVAKTNPSPAIKSLVDEAKGRLQPLKVGKPRDLSGGSGTISDVAHPEHGHIGTVAKVTTQRPVSAPGSRIAHSYTRSTEYRADPTAAPGRTLSDSPLYKPEVKGFRTRAQATHYLAEQADAKAGAEDARVTGVPSDPSQRGIKASDLKPGDVIAHPKTGQPVTVTSARTHGQANLRQTSVGYTDARGARRMFDSNPDQVHAKAEPAPTGPRVPGEPDTHHPVSDLIPVDGLQRRYGSKGQFVAPTPGTPVRSSDGRTGVASGPVRPSGDGKMTVGVHWDQPAAAPAAPKPRTDRQQSMLDSAKTEVGGSPTGHVTHLQGIGKHPAKPVSEVQPGDKIVYNHGMTGHVVDNKDLGNGKHEITTREGKPELGTGPGGVKDYISTRKSGTLVGWRAGDGSPPPPLPGEDAPSVEGISRRSATQQQNRSDRAAQAERIQADVRPFAPGDKVTDSRGMTQTVHSAGGGRVYFEGGGSEDIMGVRHADPGVPTPAEPGPAAGGIIPGERNHPESARALRESGFKVGDRVQHNMRSRDHTGKVTSTVQPHVHEIAGVSRNGNAVLRHPETGSTYHAPINDLIKAPSAPAAPTNVPGAGAGPGPMPASNDAGEINNLAADGTQNAMDLGYDANTPEGESANAVFEAINNTDGTAQQKIDAGVAAARQEAIDNPDGKQGSLAVLQSVLHADGQQAEDAINAPAAPGAEPSAAPGSSIVWMPGVNLPPGVLVGPNEYTGSSHSGIKHHAVEVDGKPAGEIRISDHGNGRETVAVKAGPFGSTKPVGSRQEALDQIVAKARSGDSAPAAPAAEPDLGGNAVAEAERTGHIGNADPAALARNRTDDQLKQIAGGNPNTMEGRVAARELARRQVESNRAGAPGPLSGPDLGSEPVSPSGRSAKMQRAFQAASEGDHAWLQAHGFNSAPGDTLHVHDDKNHIAISKPGGDTTIRRVNGNGQAAGQDVNLNRDVQQVGPETAGFRTVHAPNTAGAPLGGEAEKQALRDRVAQANGGRSAKMERAFTAAKQGDHSWLASHGFDAQPGDSIHVHNGINHIALGKPDGSYSVHEVNGNGQASKRGMKVDPSVGGLPGGFEQVHGGNVAGETVTGNEANRTGGETVARPLLPVEPSARQRILNAQKTVQDYEDKPLNQRTSLDQQRYINAKRIVDDWQNGPKAPAAEAADYRAAQPGGGRVYSAAEKRAAKAASQQKVADREAREAAMSWPEYQDYLQSPRSPYVWNPNDPADMKWARNKHADLQREHGTGPKA